jgi:transcriptional antiterminator Rof (Rho-off)
LCEAYDNLEMELLHRLRFGESRDGEAKFDNANALRLLTQHRETVARQRAIRENSDIKQVRASIHAKLLALRDQVLAQRKAEQEMTGAAHG